MNFSDSLTLLAYLVGGFGGLLMANRFLNLPTWQVVVMIFVGPFSKRLQNRARVGRNVTDEDVRRTYLGLCYVMWGFFLHSISFGIRTFCG